jgi:hypothetical protein
MKYDLFSEKWASGFIGGGFLGAGLGNSIAGNAGAWWGMSIGMLVGILLSLRGSRRMSPEKWRQYWLASGEGTRSAKVKKLQYQSARKCKSCRHGGTKKGSENMNMQEFKKELKEQLAVVAEDLAIEHELLTELEALRARKRSAAIKFASGLGDMLDKAFDAGFAENFGGNFMPSHVPMDGKLVPVEELSEEDFQRIFGEPRQPVDLGAAASSADNGGEGAGVVGTDDKPASADPAPDLAAPEVASAAADEVPNEHRQFFAKK